MNQVEHNGGGAAEHPVHPSGLCVAALANLWLAEPESSVRREELIELARTKLGKYDLTPDELDEAAPLLAKSLHMRMDRNGGNMPDDALMQEIERHVLEWCGCFGHSNS